MGVCKNYPLQKQGLKLVFERLQKLRPVFTVRYSKTDSRSSKSCFSALVSDSVTWYQLLLLYVRSLVQSTIPVDLCFRFKYLSENFLRQRKSKIELSSFVPLKERLLLKALNQKWPLQQSFEFRPICHCLLPPFWPFLNQLFGCCTTFSRFHLL